MAHTLLTSDIVLNEAHRILENEMHFIPSIDKQHDKQTTISNLKTGGSIKIRRPNQFEVRDGWTVNVQDVVEESDTLTIGTAIGVDFALSDAELALDINDFSKQFLTPAMIKLAHMLDSRVFAGAYKDVYNFVGTPGTTPAGFQVYRDAATKLSNSSVPTSMRKCIINPDAEGSTAGNLLPLFNPQGAISTHYKEGTLGRMTGFDFMMSQHVPNHTTGTTVDDAGVIVDEDPNVNIAEGMVKIHVDALDSATGTIKEGDVFTIANVYAVNPVTKQTLSYLQQFVVQSDVTASGSECDITFLPEIRSTGARQTVSALPIDGAAVTFQGTASTVYPQNLAFHPEFATFATANLPMPDGVSFKAQKSYKGINMRVLRDYDIVNAREICRFDIFYGYLVQLPAYACRITG